MYAILVKIWKWLKLLNSVPFIKKTLWNHVCIRIYHLYWLSQFYIEWGQASNISKFSRYAKVKLCDSGRNLKMTKLLNSVKLIKKTVVNQVYIRIWSLWLTFTVSQWMKKNSKIIQFSNFPGIRNVRVCDLGQNLIMNKTS